MYFQVFIKLGLELSNALPKFTLNFLYCALTYVQQNGHFSEGPAKMCFVYWPLANACVSNSMNKQQSMWIYEKTMYNKTRGPRWPWIAHLIFWDCSSHFFFVAFREEFTRISLCLYSARSPHSLIPCLLTDQNFKNNSEKGHSRNISMRLFQNLTIVSEKIF